MAQAHIHPTTAPPDDPIRSALDDPEMRGRLARKAQAVLRGRETPQGSVEDAVQTTLQRAWAKRTEYQSDSGPPAAWLAGILANVLREMLRSGGRPAERQSPGAPGLWEVMSNQGPVDVAVIARLDSAVYLAKLPARDRELLDLRFQEGLEPQEIAARLGTSPGTARTRLCRALTAIRLIAGEAEEEGRP